MLKVAFLDRDGVINIDYGHVYKKENFIFIEDVIDAMMLLNANEFKIIIVTNQAGIAKGLYSEDDYNKLTTWYLDFLKEKGIDVDFFCDSDERKHHLKVEQKNIISPEKLKTFEKDTDIFVCNIYFSSIVPFLKESGLNFLITDA